MNFLPATLDDGYLEIGDQQMYLPEYAHVKNTAITLGIRPEHSEVCADLVMNALPLELRISVVEPLGPNQLVHGLVNEQPFIAVTPETTLCQAVPLGLSIDKSNLHIFDNHGKRIHPNNFTSQESHEDATSLTTALA